MHNFISVKVLQAKDDAGDKETRFVFFELPAISDVISHVTTVTIIHGKEELFSGLEGINHID